MNVDKKAVKDLIDELACNEQAAYEVLESMKEVLPLIEGLETSVSEVAVGHKILERLVHRNPDKNKDYVDHVRYQLPKVLREIQNYLPECRGHVIDAAIGEVLRTGGIGKQLEVMVPDVKRAWENLGPQQRALMTIFNALVCLDDCSDAHYLDDLLKIEGDPNILRGDRAFTKILEAYDLAEAYLAAIQ